MGFSSWVGGGDGNERLNIFVKKPTGLGKKKGNMLRNIRVSPKLVLNKGIYQVKIGLNLIGNRTWA